MIKPQRLWLFVVLVAVAGYGLLNYLSSSGSSNQGEVPSPLASQSAPPTATNPLVTEFLINKELGPGPDNSEPAGGCLTLTQFMAHPIFFEHHYRLDAFRIRNRAMASYRGIPRDALANFAAQGDSAAMAVLGAMSYLEAIGLSKDQAVTYLSKEPITIPAYQIQRGLTPEQAKHFREARDWYYKAALHGRLLALNHVGSIVAYLEVGPKGRERFENEGWEGVQDLLNRAIYLSDVHAAMPQQIAPQLCGGALNFCVMPGSDEQIAMTTDLVRQFEQDRQDAGLPPVGIPESTAPTGEELKSMICESYLDSNGNIAW